VTSLHCTAPNAPTATEPYLPITGKNILLPANLAAANSKVERINRFLVFISADQAFSNAGILFAVEHYRT
jgi:hypothetical protein